MPPLVQPRENSHWTRTVVTVIKTKEIHSTMDRVTIRLNKEAYTYLRASKLKGESFSDVILRFKKEQKKTLD